MGALVITKAVGGDLTHQLCAFSYIQSGMTDPVAVMASMKSTGYLFKSNNVTYKLQASSVASIITGANMIVGMVSKGTATCTKSKGLTFKSKGTSNE